MNLFWNYFLAKILAIFQKIVLIINKNIMTIKDPEFMKRFMSPISYYSNVGLKGGVSLNLKIAS